MGWRLAEEKKEGQAKGAEETERRVLFTRIETDTRAVAEWTAFLVRRASSYKFLLGPSSLAFAVETYEARGG